MRPSIRDFRDLRVWRDAMEWAEQIYRHTEKFPRQEAYGLVAQLRRAAVSVSSNIAEGHRRDSTREYLHYIAIAQGSAAEVETQIELSRRLGFIGNEEAADLQKSANSIEKQLYALRNSLRSRLSPGPRSPIPDPRV